MIHHIITTACNKECPYCINELQEIGDPKNKKHAHTEDIELKYAAIVDKYEPLNKITITGGEPSLFKDFRRISEIARIYFDEVNLITANREVLTSNKFKWIDETYDNIMFSLHEPYIEDFFSTKSGEFHLNNHRKCLVYLTCLVPLYETMIGPFTDQLELLNIMMFKKFDGLTIREQWPDGKKCMYPIPQLANFSVRYKKKEHCETQTFLIPDLTLKTHKTKYDRE